MTEKAQEVMTLALELEMSERRQVIAELVASLENEPASQLHPDWSQEILHRLRDVEMGSAKPVPWNKVREDLLDKSQRVS